MDLLDIILEEGSYAPQALPLGVQGPLENVKPAEIANGVIPLSFFQNPLPRAQEEDFARLKRLLPHP